MTMLNVSLSDVLLSFVDEQVARHGYSNSGEYVCDLIRKDQKRQHLHQLLLNGAASPLTEPVDISYFEELRRQTHARSTE